MPQRTVTVAGTAGFCFGVKRATELIEAKIAERDGSHIYTVGKLIHNDTYNARLEAAGVTAVGEGDIAGLAAGAGPDSRVTLFVRAHGMTLQTDRLLKESAARNPYFTYVDCTCPFVKKIHRIAEGNSPQPGDAEERIFILIGSADHPEVKGIVSYFSGRSFVFPDSAALAEAASSGALPAGPGIVPAVAAQTTQRLSEWKKSLEIIKKLYTKSVIFDTICNVTENRQLEAERLAAECDFVIVIGGQDSSNTSKLFSICSSGCPRTVRIADASELAGKIPSDCRKVGIVAGASTPGDIIEEVYSLMSEEKIDKVVSEAENFEEMLDSAIKTLNSGDTVTGTVIAVNDQEIKLDLGAKVTGILTADQISDDASLKLSSEYKVGDEIEVFVIRVSDIDGTATVSKKRADRDKNWHMVTEAKESGESIEGTVSEAVKGGVVIRLYGSRIFIPASQTTVPKDGDLSVLVGKTVKFKVTEIRPGGKGVIGSIRAAVREERKALEEEFWKNIEVGKYYDGTVRGLTEYGAFIDLGGVDGMLHKKEMSWRPIRRPADLLKLGDPIRVFVKSYDPEKRQITLGYRTEEMHPWNKFKAAYQVGDDIDVTVSNIMSYGAFAHITDEIDGLIHYSEIAAEPVENPADVLVPGQQVRVRIIKIDDDQHRVSLSIKALLGEAGDGEEADGAEDAAEADAPEEEGQSGATAE
jgi:4-hydroxy-3-methylbut-2-enyl diphosphate reductase